MLKLIELKICLICFYVCIMGCRLLVLVLWLGNVMLIVLVVRCWFSNVLVRVWWWVVSVVLICCFVMLMWVFLVLCVLGLSLLRFFSNLVSVFDLLRNCVFLFLSVVMLVVCLKDCCVLVIIWFRFIDFIIFNVIWFWWVKLFIK